MSMKNYVVRKLLCSGISLSLIAACGLGKAAIQSPVPIPWSQIGATAGADYKGDGLSVAATQTGARLHCVFQRLDGEATLQGLQLISTATNKPGDRFGVTAIKIERKQANTLFDSQGAEGDLELSADGVISLNNQIVRFTRPELTEEYSVSIDGLRQDFIVQQAPPGPQSGELVVQLSVTGAKVESAPYGATLVLENSGRKIAYARMRVTDATGKTLPARIEASRAQDGLERFASLSDSGSFDNEPSFLAPRGSDAILAVVVDDSDAAYPVRIDPTLATITGSAPEGSSAQPVKSTR
jgi:hypothetical protein